MTGQCAKEKQVPESRIRQAALGVEGMINTGQMRYSSEAVISRPKSSKSDRK